MDKRDGVPKCFHLVGVCGEFHWDPTCAEWISLAPTSTPLAPRCGKHSPHRSGRGWRRIPLGSHLRQVDLTCAHSEPPCAPLRQTQPTQIWTWVEQNSTGIPLAPSRSRLRPFGAPLRVRQTQPTQPCPTVGAVPLQPSPAVWRDPTAPNTAHTDPTFAHLDPTGSTFAY